MVKTPFNINQASRRPYNQTGDELKYPLEFYPMVATTPRLLLRWGMSGVTTCLLFYF
jgi:hypothetical protein